jgi:large subunit ribosomal protein L13
MAEQIVIDATGAALGRLASYAAKQALLGKSVVIINCNNAIIIGRTADIVGSYKQKAQRGKGTQKGPYFPRTPERIVKRTARGMLEYTQQRGWDAFRRIICHNETPKEFEAAKKITLAKEVKAKSIKLNNLVERV